MKRANYPVLAGKIAERGIRQTVIAARLGINVKTLYNKMYGDSEFTWSEAYTIRQEFFPDVDYVELMS